MYFHPLILTEAQKQQRSAAYQDCADRRFDGIDRQHWLHTDAASEFAIRREEILRTLSGSIDTADFVVLCVVRAASASLELLQVSTWIATPENRLEAVIRERVGVLRHLPTWVKLAAPHREMGCA